MPGPLDVDATFFTFLGYEMSYLEFAGTVLNIASVWLVARNNIWTWPVGIAAVILFALLFYQIQLYSDFVEQIYFLVTGFYGWWVWVRLRGRRLEAGNITTLSGTGVLGTLVIVAGGTAAMAFVAGNIHEWLPRLFSKPAAFPFLDAFTTVMSFTAQLLMAHKKLESWYLWIAVDIIGIGLYYVRGVKLVALLYVIFLMLASRGYLNWRRAIRVSERALPATAAQ